MTEVEMPDVSTEIATTESEDMGNAHTETESPEVNQVQETDKEMNFRNLRESNEQLQRQIQEDRVQNQQDRQMMQAMQTEIMKRGETPPTPDEFDGVDKSDWATIEQSERIADKRFEKKWAAAEEKRKQEDSKRRQEEAPQRIKTRFPDFDAVVTQDNVKQLQALEPDVAQALSMIGDEEAKAIAAYKYIKAFVPQAAASTASKQRIQQNANQPKSLSSTGGASPLSQAGAFENGLTPDLKKHLFAEMQECASKS